MHRMQFDHAFGPSITRNLIMCVLTICHMNLMQNTAMKQLSMKRHLIVGYDRCCYGYH